ncbi:phage portal protein [Billgrantia pellis]|uniref:Phage portal protein n=1 Tax=Billgrantia pellis TaxID=2606936 RepID=A0A7V7G638_9GAMM|nr:phage portal protein [Halomonas pellis]KAA0014423.1 phage portal protein [Halomonas pellis]
MLKLFQRRQADPIAEKPRMSRMRQIPRAIARSLLGQARADRLSGDMPTVPVPADDFIDKNQRALVARSRHLVLTNDYARGFVRQVRQNLVGRKGIQLQAQARDADGTLDERANDAIEADFEKWCDRRICDVSGRRSFRQLLARAAEDAATNGEFMFRLVYGRDLNPWGVALQVLDPQRCPVEVNEDRLPDGQFIRQGIKYNRWGRPVAYLFGTVDPAESDYRFGGRNYVEIPADELIHGFLEDLVGQRRGLPWMVTAVMRLHHLDGFEKAALVNARVSASKGGFFEWDEGMGPSDEEDTDEPLYMDAEPGSYQELPAGLRFKGWDPQFPSGELAPFSKQSLRGIATGLGVSYNSFANDLEGVNFSSIRQGVLTERDQWMDLQEWLIEQLLEPVFQAWLPRALLKGISVPGTNGATLRPERIEKYREHDWQARRWDWVDPDKDSKTAARDIANKIKSPSQVIRERGGDPRTVWRQWATDRQAMIDAGIPEALVDATLGDPTMNSGSSTPQGETAGETSNEG